MPRRTNRFQSEIYLLQQHIDPAADVTESAELPSLLTGGSREVDVCIRAHVAGQPVTVGVECRDWSRPQGPAWVEEMHGKHSHLPTDRLVLVSKSGFTREALKLAHAWKIETIVPEELTDEQAGDLATRLRNVVLGRMDFHIEAALAQIASTDDKPVQVVSLAGPLPLFTETGEAAGTMQQLVQSMVVRGLDETDVPEQSAASFEGAMADPTGIRDGQPFPLHLNVDGQLRCITRIEVRGEMRSHEVQVSVQHRKYQDTRYSWAEAVAEPAVFLITEGSGHELVWRFKNPDQSAQAQ